MCLYETQISGERFSGPLVLWFNEYNDQNVFFCTGKDQSDYSREHTCIGVILVCFFRMPRPTNIKSMGYIIINLSKRF